MAEGARAEAERLLAVCGGEAGMLKAMEVLRAQFTTIQSRTQLLLTLATITLTITGFSGRSIASSGAFARGGMAAGLICVLAAIMLMLGGLRVRWLTQFSGADPLAILSGIIAYRDAKTANYRLQTALLAVGLGCYVAAVVAFLVVAPT